MCTHDHLVVLINQVFIHVWIQARADDLPDAATAELLEFINSTVKKDHPDMASLLIKELEEKARMAII